MNIEQRFEQMERQIRRLRLAVFGLVAVLLAVPLVGAVVPQGIPELIQARTIGVVDASGRLRSVMTDDGIGYYDERGTLRAQMTVDGFRAADASGRNRAGLGAVGIMYADANGNILWGVPE